MNIHADTDKKPPADWTQARRVLALVRFWHGFHPVIREHLLSDDNFSSFSETDGILEALLKGIDDLDPKKLEEELKEAGLLEEPPAPEEDKPLTVQETAELLGASHVERVGDGGVFHPLFTFRERITVN